MSLLFTLMHPCWINKKNTCPKCFNDSFHKKYQDAVFNIDNDKKKSWGPNQHIRITEYNAF